MKLLLKVNSERTRKRHRSGNTYDSNGSNAVASVKRIEQSKTTTHNEVTQKFTITGKLLIVLVTLMIIIIGTVTYIEIKNKSKTEPRNEPILFGDNYENGTFPNLGNGHLVIDRTQWGSSELAKPLTIPLTHPIPYVMITHVGSNSKPCINIYKCSIKMRTLQDLAISERLLPDIQSNFYIGDDGNLYVARGWNWANSFAENSLAITLMGDYEQFTPTAKQLDAVQHLLTYGLVNKFIQMTYKLVAQNQTKISSSPGAKAYEKIKKWEHFYPCSLNGYTKCGSELGMSDESWDGDM